MGVFGVNYGAQVMGWFRYSIYIEVILRGFHMGSPCRGVFNASSPLMKPYRLGCFYSVKINHHVLQYRGNLRSPRSEDVASGNRLDSFFSVNLVYRGVFMHLVWERVIW